MNSIDDFNRGDKIRIILLDDTLLNIDYKGKEGIIESINYVNNFIKGTWGPIELYPEYDEIKIIEHYDKNS